MLMEFRLNPKPMLRGALGMHDIYNVMYERLVPVLACLPTSKRRVCKYYVGILAGSNAVHGIDANPYFPFRHKIIYFLDYTCSTQLSSTQYLRAGKHYADLPPMYCIARRLARSLKLGCDIG